MLEWFQNLRNNNVKVNGPTLVEKANQFAILLNLPATCDINYINRWRKRNNIVCQFKEHGESASVNKDTVREWRLKLENVCANYKDEDIFNADETGLFYQMTPTRTFKFRHETCSGGKQSKVRCSILSILKIMLRKKKEM